MTMNMFVFTFSTLLFMQTKLVSATDAAGTTTPRYDALSATPVNVREPDVS